jgi:hypothetical protein
VAPTELYARRVEKRLRRRIFCASGNPLSIVFGEADPPLAGYALVPVQFVAQAIQ